MKKNMFLFFFFFTLFSTLAQNTIKTSTPCNDTVLFKTPGKWFIEYGGMLDNGSEHIPFNKTQVKETVMRMNLVRDMLMKIIPVPMGVDAAWHNMIGLGSFGEQMRYVQNSQGTWNAEPLIKKNVASFGFACGFFAHSCYSERPYEIGRGYPGETDTWFTVGANGIGNVAGPISPGGNNTNMLINGYPVHLRQPMKEQLDGYELYLRKTNVFPGIINNGLCMLFHRKGEMPFIPVTRKQYLDQAIIYLTQIYREALKGMEQVAAETSEEQRTRKEQIDKFIKNRDAVLDHYKAELDESSKKGLLGSPAVIPQVAFAADDINPVFVDQSVGYTIVIENPAYMRKDLPKYVPQILAISWGWNEYWKPQADVGRLILEKFPFGQIQAMIDR